MDRDPPPSYNSVVRKRDDSQQADKDLSPANFKNHNQEVAERERKNQEDTLDRRGGEHFEDSTRDAQPTAGQPAELGQESGQQQQQQRTGLWERFKKGLEDAAFFVIQILD